MRCSFLFRLGTNRVIHAWTWELRREQKKCCYLISLSFTKNSLCQLICASERPIRLIKQHKVQMFIEIIFVLFIKCSLLLRPLVDMFRESCDANERKNKQTRFGVLWNKKKKYVMWDLEIGASYRDRIRFFVGLTRNASVAHWTTYGPLWLLPLNSELVFSLDFLMKHSCKRVFSLSLCFLVWIRSNEKRELI